MAHRMNHWITVSTIITAIATVFIATFNFLLSRIGKGQLTELTRQVNLAREQFISAHRPRIRARGFDIGDRDLPHGKPIRVVFIAQNIGETPAHLTELKGCIHIARSATAPIPTRIEFPFHNFMSIALKGGEIEALYVEDGTTTSQENATEIYAGDMPLFCIGVIIYTDDSGVQRETGFCRRFSFRPYNSETIQDSEYEYEY